MSNRIEQDFKYVGEDYWRWWAWIEADGAELDKVKEVIWLLHPSFKQSRVVATKRSDNFRLATAGWGTFLLRAEVVLADEQKWLLKHNLRLEYPEPRARAPVSRQPTIYLSYSQQDSRVAGQLRAGLENAGLKVLDQTSLGENEPWSGALGRMMAQSDAVVGLVGEDEISPWVNAEIKTAAASSKPIFVLLPAGASSVGLPQEVQIIAVDMNRIDPMEIAGILNKAIP
jgi:hypothetical protein